MLTTTFTTGCRTPRHAVGSAPAAGRTRGATRFRLPTGASTAARSHATTSTITDQGHRAEARLR